MCEHVLGFLGDVSSSLAEVTCSSFMYFIVFFIVFMSVTYIHLCYVKKSVATAHLYDTNLSLIVIVKNSTFCKCGWRALFCFSRVIRGTRVC